MITGGGEPTLLAHDRLGELVAVLRESLPYILLISNWSIVWRWADKDGEAAARTRLESWRAAGLSRLAVSRHGVDRVQDAALMGLAVDTPRVIRLARDAGLPVRGICVLQRSGVASVHDVEAHLRHAVQNGLDEVCFKELYVSALSENPWAPSRENRFCEQHQVPLAVVLETMDRLGFVQSGALPWGSPVFEGTLAGQPLRVAAYTEPSVGWERRHGVVHSWSWLSDGACLASLEDPASRLSLPTEEPCHE